MKEPRDPHLAGCEAKTAVTQAFKALRKQGLIARQNFMCCSNCACVAADDMADKRIAAGKEFRGAVYYCRQNDILGGEPLYIKYWGNEDKEEIPKDQQTTTKQVGEMLSLALVAAGAHVIWDGDPCKAIIVDPLPELKRDVA